MLLCGGAGGLEREREEGEATGLTPESQVDLGSSGTTRNSLESSPRPLEEGPGQDAQSPGIKGPLVCRVFH